MSQQQPVIGRAGANVPGNLSGPAAAAALKHLDDEPPPMTSVPASEDTAAQQWESSSPPFSAPATLEPRLGAPAPAMAPRAKTFEEKIAPAQDPKLIQPQKKLFNRIQPLAHIMKGSFESTDAESKFGRRSAAESDAKDQTDAAKVAKSLLRMIIYIRVCFFVFFLSMICTFRSTAAQVEASLVQLQLVPI